MFDILRKAMLLGIGAITLSEERARTIINELIEQGKVSKEEGEALAGELKSKAEASRKEWEEKVREMVQEGMRKVDIVPRADYDALMKRVEELTARLDAAEKKAES